MTLPRGRQHGGFIKPIQLSLFIRDALADGRETWGYNLHQAYVTAARAIPTARGGKRRVINYNGFQHYLYVLRRLGLIEYVTDEKGNLKTETPTNKRGDWATDDGTQTGAPYIAEVIFFRAVLSRINDPAWANIWAAYEKIR